MNIEYQHKHIHIPADLNINAPSIDFNIYYITIIPRGGIENGIPFKITSISEFYHIKAFHITTYNNRLKQVGIVGRHPNANPDTAFLCLSDYFIGKEVLDIEKLIRDIVIIIQSYDLDDAFFKPKRDSYNREPLDAAYITNYKERNVRLWRKKIS